MKQKNTTEQSLKIPADILLDVLAIVVRESLRHQVTEVIESRSMVMLSLHLNDNLLKHQRALQNIQGIVEEYNEYRYLENEEINWKD